MFPVSNDKRIHVNKFKIYLVTIYFKIALGIFTIAFQLSGKKKNKILWLKRKILILHIRPINEAKSTSKKKYFLFISLNSIE